MFIMFSIKVINRLKKIDNLFEEVKKNDKPDN